MTLICRRCGGFVIGEREVDYYQPSHWRCVNCGWYHRGASVSPVQARDRRIVAPGS